MAQFKGNSHDAKRARQGARIQEEMKEAFDDKIRKMKEETDKLHNTELSTMFSMDDSISHQKFAAATVGLQTHEQYKTATKLYLNHQPQQSDASTSSSSPTNDGDKEANASQPQKPKTKRSLISFADDSEDGSESDEDLDSGAPTNDKKRTLEESEIEADTEQAVQPHKRRKLIRKNPNVNTSFLPDPERDLMDAKLRSDLEQEWYAQQQQIKTERLEITYSYWDGSGHRRTIEITKGISVGQFLELARKELSSNFNELRGLDSASLMYIKDDLIIPHSYLFYDLIVTNSKGKSGHYMFKHQATTDKGDYVIGTDLGHAGKIITRSWFDRNKHIFPASRWELYDPLIHSK